MTQIPSRPWALSAAVVALTVGLISGCEKSAPEEIAAAQKALAAGEMQRAMIHLKSAAAADPKNAQARFLLGQRYAAAGDAPSAAEEFKRALALKYPADELARPLADALLLSNQLTEVRMLFASLPVEDPQVKAKVETAIAWANLGLGDLTGAREAIDKVDKLEGPTAETRLIRARLADMQGDPEQALKLVDALLEDEPRHDGAWAFKGQLHERQPGGSSQARDAYRQALAANPKNFVALASTVGIHLLNKDLNAAREGLATMRKLGPRAFMTFYHDGQLKYLEGDYAGARGRYQEALRLAPDSTIALLASGINELNLNSHALAESQLTRVVRLESSNSVAAFYLARAYLAGGKPERVTATLAPFIGTAEPLPEILILAAQARLLQGDSKGADQLFTRAAKLHAADPSVRTALALRELAKGNSDAAMQELQKIAASSDGTAADMQLISAHIVRKDYPAALAAIQWLESKQPMSPTADDLRGQVLLQTGNKVEARKAFESALKKDPRYLLAVAHLADLDVMEGHLERAQERLTAQSVLDPGNASLHVALAALAQRAGAGSPAILKELEKAVQADPLNVNARLMLIDRHYADGNIERALEAAQSAAAAIPDNVQIYEALARCFTRLGDMRQALATYAKYARLAPKAPEGYLGQAKLLLDMSDFAGANKVLQQLLVIDPKNLEAKRLTATVALLQKQPDKALGLSRELQRDFPDSFWGFALEGEVQMDQKRWDPAAAAFRAATARPGGAAFVTRQHTALMNANKADEADRLVVEWTAQHPRNAVLLRHLAATAYNAGAQAQARAYYERALEIAPKDPAILNNLAWILVETKDPNALAMAERAAAEAPQDPSVLDTLAHAYALQNDYRKATEVMRRAVQRASAPAPFRLRLARLYLAANDRDSARAELETLRDLGKSFPEQAEVRRLLAQTRQ